MLCLISPLSFSGDLLAIYQVSDSILQLSECSSSTVNPFNFNSNYPNYNYGSYKMSNTTLLPHEMQQTIIQPSKRHLDVFSQAGLEVWKWSRRYLLQIPPVRWSHCRCCSLGKSSHSELTEWPAHPVWC